MLYLCQPVAGVVVVQVEEDRTHEALVLLTAWTQRRAVELDCSNWTSFWTQHPMIFLLLDPSTHQDTARACRC